MFLELSFELQFVKIMEQKRKAESDANYQPEIKVQKNKEIPFVLATNEKGYKIYKLSGSLNS